MDRKLAIDNAINKVNLYSSLMQAIVAKSDGKLYGMIRVEGSSGRGVKQNYSRS
jgi:hypothetical protein